MKVFKTFTNTCVLLSFSLYVLAEPPMPPVGYQWEPVVQLSDEFDDNTVDESKWYKYNPSWVGRDPGRFKEEQVTESDGMLHLQNTKVAETSEEVWVHTGFLASKEKSFLPDMYSECKMKVATDGTVTGFWMSTPGYYEIDVQEAIGYAPNGNLGLANLMRMNTHHHPDGWDSDIATPKTFTIGSVSESFHVYGTWFVDLENIYFYHDDEWVTDVVTGGAFDLGMQINIDTECQTWLGDPIPSRLSDASKNTTYVDYVRTWKLVSTTEGSEEQEIAIQNVGTSKLISFGGDVANELSCTANQISELEKFTITDLGGGIITLRGTNGKYISSEHGSVKMTCLSDTAGETEQFSFEHIGNDVYAIKGNNGEYVGSDMWCNNASDGNDERFKIIWDTETVLELREMEPKRPLEITLKAFPNPASDILYISGILPGTYQAAVYSLQGNLIKQNVLNNQTDIATLQIDNLAEGLYLLQLHSNYSVESIRFIKQ